MKQKKNISKLIVYVLFLMIVTSIIMAHTFTRYTEGQEAAGNAEIARWSFKVNGLEEPIIKRTTATEHIADGKLAPGTNGMFEIVIDATGCEVELTYEIEILNIENKPVNFKFYQEEQYGVELIPEIVDGKAVYKISGSMLLSEIEKNPIRTVAIYWKWNYETEIEDGDGIDTEDGKNANNMSFDVKITGTQKTLETYEIIYDANGGEGAPSNQTKEQGVNLTLSTIKPTKEGYTFIGWSTNRTATTATYQPGDEYELDTDITLYAVWEKIYIITFSNGPSVSTGAGNYSSASKSSVATIPAGCTISLTLKTSYSGSGGANADATFNGISIGSINGNNSKTVTYVTPSEGQLTINASSGGSQGGGTANATVNSIVDANGTMYKLS